MSAITAVPSTRDRRSVIDRWLDDLGHHFILLMMILTRLFGATGGLLVIYYVEFTMDLAHSTRMHFRVAALIVVVIACLLSILLAMWETRHLREALKLLKAGAQPEPALAVLAGREAVEFTARHHKNEAWLVPCSTWIPLLLVLRIVDQVSLAIMVNITVAVFMAISMALMSHFFAIEHCMKSVIRYLLSERIPIDYKTMKPGRLRYRMRVCFTLIIATTALMIGTVAIQRATEMSNHPETQKQSIQELRYHSVFITTVALVMGIAYSTIVGDSVAHRVGKLVRAMDRVGSGDLSERVTPTGNDELDMLARRFNLMVEQMEINHQTICDLNANLEQKVNQRTQELNGTISTLRETQLKLTAYNEDLEQARAVAESASKTKSEFLASISHELRTPLNGVIGLNDLLLKTDLDNQQTKYATAARSSGESLLHLVNEVLDFSKIEAGKLELETIDFDLVQVVESVISTEAYRCEPGVEMICSIDPRIPSCLRGDPGRIRQILNNLASNAVKFTEQGEVFVRVSALTESAETVRVQFEVRDTGIGIPEDHLGPIFDAFTQADSSTTRKYGGTGLGLGICKQLCAMMGGEMDVTSTVGEGSCFSFTARLTKGSPTKQPAVTIPQEMRQGRCLVVDDNDAVCTSLGQQIADWGLEVHTSTDSEDGLQQLQSALKSGRPYDLVLLDVDLNDANGDGLARTFRSEPGFDQTMLTALIPIPMGTCVIADSLHSNGFDDYLEKPALRSEVLRTVMNAMRITHQMPDPRIPSDRLADDAPKRNKRAARILLAEDQEINQLVVVETLAQAGFDCDVVNNGRAAVESLEKIAYDLVLMDCHMPEMDGFEATRLIRAKEENGRSERAAATPIVALTANAMRGERERCLDAGMTDYLSKPLRPEELIDTIERCIQEYDRIGDEYAAGGDEQSAAGDTHELACHEILDVDSLLHRCNGKTELATKLISKFQNRVPQDLMELQQCIEDRDSAKLIDCAHKLKSVAASLGAESIQQVADKLQEIGHHDCLDEAPDQMDELRKQCDRFSEHFQSIAAHGILQPQHKPS